jgi:hypothetical protein
MAGNILNDKFDMNHCCVFQTVLYTGYLYGLAAALYPCVYDTWEMCENQRWHCALLCGYQESDQGRRWTL